MDRKFVKQKHNFMFLSFTCLYRDLAIDMRMKLGDWFQVVQLLEVGGSVGKHPHLLLTLPHSQCLPRVLPSQVLLCSLLQAMTPS